MADRMAAHDAELAMAECRGTAPSLIICASLIL
jgi:hypothetical protein